MSANRHDQWTKFLGASNVLRVDLRNVDLNLLVAFDALLTERSVTAAAQRLSVGQSAMSSTLARLRTLLNDPVLERHGRAMIPTPLAESLVLPVREALMSFSSILSEQPAFDPACDRRSFSVMASEYAALAVLQPLIVDLRETAPHVVLHIQPVSEDFVLDLTTDAVNLTIVPPQFVPEEESLHQQQLYRDPYLVAVDAANPTVTDEITLEQFSAMPYLAASSGSASNLVESQLDRLGVDRRLEVTAGFGLAPFLLRDTLLVTILPSSLASTVAEGARLKLLTPPLPLEPVTEAMVWTARNNGDPGHRWLRERLAAIASRRTWSTL